MRQSVSFGSLVAVVVVVLHFAYHKFIFSGSLILNGKKKENICFECVICLCSEQELKGHFPSVSLFISFSLFQENLLSMCVFMQQSNFACSLHATARVRQCAGKHTMWRATVCSLHKAQHNLWIVHIWLNTRESQKIVLKFGHVLGCASTTRSSQIDITY